MKAGGRPAYLSSSDGRNVNEFSSLSIIQSINSNTSKVKSETLYKVLCPSVPVSPVHAPKLTPLCFLLSQLRITALQIQHLSTLPPSPHSVRVCLPRYCIPKQTTMISSEKATFPPSFYGNKRTSGLRPLSYYSNIAENDEYTTVHMGVFERSSVNSFRLEDNCCFPWNIKVVLQLYTVRHSLQYCSLEITGMSLVHVSCDLNSILWDSSKKYVNINCLVLQEKSICSANTYTLCFRAGKLSRDHFSF